MISFSDASECEETTADNTKKTCVKNLLVWYLHWRTKQTMVPQSPEVIIKKKIMKNLLGKVGNDVIVFMSKSVTYQWYINMLKESSESDDSESIQVEVQEEEGR